MTSGRQELARAGYAWEIGDAPILHASLSLADLAHVLELERLHAIPAETCRILVRELLHILELPSGAIPYDPAYGEMYSSRERYLIGRIGDNAGWLHSGRTRREAMRIAYRLVVRRQILDLIGAACGLAGALCDQGGQHVETVMPDYTYLQPANPTTFPILLKKQLFLRRSKRLQIFSVSAMWGE